MRIIGGGGRRVSEQGKRENAGWVARGGLSVLGNRVKLRAARREAVQAVGSLGGPLLIAAGRSWLRAAEHRATHKSRHGYVPWVIAPWLRALSLSHSLSFSIRYIYIYVAPHQRRTQPTWPVSRTVHYMLYDIYPLSLSLSFSLSCYVCGDTYGKFMYKYKKSKGRTSWIYEWICERVKERERERDVEACFWNRTRQRWRFDNRNGG